ncbi:hypothetical protein D8674_020726 [Pyrus ussuriensis x Pyrus communis]|uniref:XS domain-containing protein n=1 Tax=Pyrus ussuriensis x Pyrus communis TaxID=2448454 RepID=A0A5N5HHI9_9ROSA|nr:uncharacterized protein LOC103947004 [Pyrus x bretschneideri]XP_048428570.1 uncharacterized protein LOC103947004 [Pyrus x bretschneideri]KAB2627108.1 hypothetical protein D8674_020726 [Pyrus ussuriensis x Pyrus communis]
MHSRKHENFNKQSPASRLHAVAPDPYSNSSRRSNMQLEAADQSSGRSLSPRGLPGDVGLSQRTDSIERSDHGWHLGGRRTDRVRRRSRSTSPPLPFGGMQKRPHFDEGVGVMHRNYSSPPLAPVSSELQHRPELVEPAKYRVNDDSNSRRVYGSENNDSRISNEELNESRLSVGVTHGTLSQKSMHVEDGAVRGLKSTLMQDNTALGTYWPPPDLHPVIAPAKDCEHLPSSSRSMNLPHFEHGRPQYTDPVALDRLPVTESYKGEKPILTSRDGLYPMVSGAHYTDFHPSSSTDVRSEFQDSYRGDPLLPSMDEFSSSRRFINAYRQRPPADYPRDPDSGKGNLAFYQSYSPNRGEHADFFYRKSRAMPVDDRRYPSDDSHKMMPPRPQLDYDSTQMVYNHRNLSRPSIMNPVMDRMGDTEEFSGNSRKGIMLNNPTLQRQPLLDYPDSRRISETSKHGAEYSGSECTHVSLERRMSQDYELSHFRASQDFQVAHQKEDYGFERDVNMKYQDRLSSVSNYDSEMSGHPAGMQIMREELGIYEPADRMLKRNYATEEGISTHNPRTMVSSKWTSREFQDSYESGEEWNDGDLGSYYTSASAGFDHDRYSKAERVYGGHRHGEYEYDDWLPSQHSFEHEQMHSVRFYKHGDRYIKGHQKSGPLSRHKLHTADIKSSVHKQHRVWKRHDNYLEDVHVSDGTDVDQSENGLSSAGPEPSEDSEEFMQMVNEAFLTFSKKLNMNSAVRRRYKEQGKAGTLFCIVCGRSLSKEFMDTQRLVRHAYMSHRVGLRAQHLGLLKAVCVLLGWSTVVPPDTVTWAPQVLPRAEALAQKEDLILWPPVIVVHNISMSDNNPQSWKVVSMEALEAFLRSNGLIKGRIKICLGKPADQSVLVVKFLGTFTGLGDAERIQKHFAEHQRGRVDFERATSSNGKIVEAAMQGDNAEERFLYGYMGIVEDLDKVDFHTRSWTVIKSKKEIQDLANAPVKPDER